MGRFVASFQFLQRTLLIIRSNVSLHAAMRIVARNALFGGLSVGNIRSHLSEQKSPSEGLCSAIKMAMIQSSSIWRVSRRSTHLSGLTFPIPTSSQLSHPTFSISYIREFSRTISSNGVLVSLEMTLLMLGSVPCPPIHTYAISRRASHQSLSGLEKNIKRCKKFFLVSLLV